MRYAELEGIAAVLDDWTSAPMSERKRAAFRLLEALTLRPHELDASFVEELESAGLTRPEVEEVAAVAFHFNFINRVADAVDFDLPDAAQNARTASILSLLGIVASGGPRPAPSWVRAADGCVRPIELETAREQLLAHQGALAPEQRHAIEARAAALWGAERPTLEFPPVLDHFVKPLSLHAYQLHDRLVEELLAAGYSQQALFEVTLLGAFGAALAGQEHLFAALIGPEREQG